MKMARVWMGLAAALVAGTMAVAQGPGGGPGAGGPGGPGFGQHRPPMERAFGGQFGRWWNNPRLAEKLKLTDDQRKAMDGILYAHREKLVDLEANLKKAELAMEPLMSADQPSQSAIYSQIDKVVAARGELERENSRFLLDIRLKLTPDQWKQLRDFRPEGPRGPRPAGGPQRQWRHRGPGAPGGQGGPGGAQPPAPNAGPQQGSGNGSAPAPGDEQ